MQNRKLKQRIINNNNALICTVNHIIGTVLKLKYNTFFLFAQCILIASFCIASSAMASNFPDKSVFRIIAGKQVGTGFVWQGATDNKYMVTSLHTLAGASRIFYNKTSASTELLVHKIDEESDLALLVPKQGQLDYPALTLSGSLPDPRKKYYIHGFPAGVKMIQGDSIEFSLGKHNITMSELLPSSILKQITASGYPQSTLRILRVSSGITPGHSGAPIIDHSNNKVIAIGAGGLSKQGFRRVNWAIPADSYLLTLEASGIKNNAIQSQRPADDNIKFSVKVEPDDSNNIVTAGISKYYKVYQVSLQDLLESLINSEDPYEDPYEDSIVDIEKLNELTNEAKEFGYSLQDAQIDVYQNTETGAMIYVPSGTALTTKDSILIANNIGGKVKIYFQIVQTDTADKALDAAQKFEYFLEDEIDTDWQVDQDYDQVPQHDLANKYYSLIARKYNTNEDDEIESDLIIDMFVAYENEEPHNYGEFLGIAILARGLTSFSEQDYVILNQMDICSEISGFNTDLYDDDKF